MKVVTHLGKSQSGQSYLVLRQSRPTCRPTRRWWGPGRVIGHARQTLSRQQLRELQPVAIQHRQQPHFDNEVESTKEGKEQDTRALLGAVQRISVRSVPLAYPSFAARCGTRDMELLTLKLHLGNN